MADDRELLALVEQERFDELHEVVSVDRIADAWLSQSAAATDELGWAVLLWYDEPDETRRREMLVTLIERADDEQLGWVAAGPLEAFAAADESRLAWIERQASCSARFREALSSVWAFDHPDVVFERLERAADAQLPHPDRARYERRARRQLPR